MEVASLSPSVLGTLQSLGLQWWLISALFGLACGAVALQTRRGFPDDIAKAVAFGLLGAYAIVMLVLTVLGRSAVVSSGLGARTIWAVRLNNPVVMRYELATNTLMLLPVGALLPAATGWGLRRSMTTCLAATSSIEMAQLATSRGCFETSDIALNMLGALAGYGLYILASGLVSRIWRR